MKQFLITVAGVFVGLALFMVGVPIVLIGLVSSAARPAPLPERTVLALDLRDGLTDQDPQGAAALFGGHGLSVVGIEDALRQAASDSHVQGLYVRLPEGGMPPAAADELATAFETFRASGKPILGMSQGLYAQGVTTSTYELAAATGNVWMQPSSSFQATGIASETLFFKRFFDKYGIKADYQQRYEYKNAVNPYLYSDYTAAHRQAELGWMNSVYDTGLTAAAAQRKLTPAALKALIEAGPYSAEDAQAKGLVDHIGQVKDAETAILKAAGAGAKFTDFTDYQARLHRPVPPVLGGRGATIALIQAEGDIVTGTGAHSSPFSGGQNIYSDDLSDAFYRAIDDKDVKAIVFRVNSPGGSDTASEQILAAVRAAKAAGKPVVVSMGTYAASGGYWISCEASEIVAEPSTLTGSIGVFGGKFALGDALARFGVDMKGLKVGGDYADSADSSAPMSPTQRAAFSAWMDRIYNGFVARVAEGRRLPTDTVAKIARGRVWTGAQAKGLGLVDSLGGLPQAIDRAKALAGISGEARIKPFATSTNPFAAIARLFGGGADTDSARLLAALHAVASDRDAKALLQDLSDARLREQGAMVLAPRWVR